MHEVMTATQGREADMLILDGEAQPTGGIGVSRQIHMEAGSFRRSSWWFAAPTTGGWPPGAGADEILVHPLDPVTAAECVAGLLRRRSAGLAPSVTETR